MHSVGDLFVAGTETTASSIRWAMLFLLHHPDIQTRLREEINLVIGEGRFPSLDDRKSLHYVEAFLAEVLRRGNIVPFAQHSNDNDTTINGFFIKAGSCLASNFDSVLMDPELFPEPDRFDPSRFLDSDGKFVGNEKLIPFGIGMNNSINSLNKTHLSYCHFSAIT